jgi:hypothetical protein
MIHHATADDAEEIARLLRSRGRIVITAPPKSGKTTELIKYAEERYPNGRFAVFCTDQDAGKYITRLHWRLYNGISQAEVVTARLLGQELEGEDVNAPHIITPDLPYLPNQTIPVFVDEFNSLSESSRLAIMRRKLFIASVTS